MREYATQMEAARKGILTEQLKTVAAQERMAPSELMELVAEGKAVICANKNHTCLKPQGVGSMLRTKINVNLGVSRDCKDYEAEMKKVMEAVHMGAHAIMDLSSHGDTVPFRRKLTAECPAMIGTVPVYDSVIHYKRDLDTLTAQDFIDVVRLHAKDGVDFVTLHCGITRKTISQIKKHKRKMNIVSRGGSLVFAWMCMTGEENPFYEYFDEIRCNDLSGRRLPSGMPCGCFRRMPDRRTGTPGRAYKTRLGAGCTGDGGRAWAYAVRPDPSKYEDPADALPRRSVLCTGAVGDRYCARV